uniref:SPATA6 domain-containing protein n=1 Tax=Mesocestoides corti TaxID=53468 RepID=A0A5K3FLG0_MESCO
MNSKGTQESIVYPHVVFPIDNFEDVFTDCVLRDSECLCVELTAYDRRGALQGVLFEGIVRYSTLKNAHDIQVNSQNNWSFASAKASAAGTGSSSKAFLRMLANRSEGIAEVVVHQTEYPHHDYQKDANNCFYRLSTSSNAFDEATENISPEKLYPVMQTRSSRPQRKRPVFAHRSATTSPLRSDSYLRGRRPRPSPSKTALECTSNSNLGQSQISQLVAGAVTNRRKRPFHTRLQQLSHFRKARSDSDNLNNSPERFRPTKNCIEVESSTFEDEFDDFPLAPVPCTETNADAIVERQATFGQAWQWFKERRRVASLPIKTAVTYVSLPWYLITSAIFETKKTPILTSLLIPNIGETEPFS